MRPSGKQLEPFQSILSSILQATRLIVILLLMFPVAKSTARSGRWLKGEVVYLKKEKKMEYLLAPCLYRDGKDVWDGQDEAAFKSAELLNFYPR